MAENHLTFKQYRSLDLFLFAAILCVAEVLVSKASTKWFAGQLYTLSVVPAIVGIVMARWGWFAVIHALLGGFVYCVSSTGTVAQFLCYLSGNLLCLVLVFAVRKGNWQKIKANTVFTILYGVCVALLMQLGRGLVALVLGYELAACVEFITTDSLSGIFAALVICIAARLDGVFEDQKHYLIRINEEKLLKEGEC